jgi:putative flippase GtrA
MSGRIPAFLSVGACGFLLQFATLAALTFAARWPYVPATALAVELAVLHNFIWHERWTWRDRGLTASGRAARLAKYHATTGLVSVGGNLLCTALLVELAGLHQIWANVAAVVAMSAANFAVSDRWVFLKVPLEPGRCHYR